VTGDWWPVTDAQPDWESMRLAALCQLIAEAEAAQESSPRLGGASGSVRRRRARGARCRRPD
jgi:hypothetical protein